MSQAITDRKSESLNSPQSRVPFKIFGAAVGKQFAEMSEAGVIFVTDVDRDELWAQYLAAFPPGADHLFKTRTEHDCSCCRHFIKTIGGVMAIREDGLLRTIWDVEIDDPDYTVVAQAMAAFVRRHEIANIFLHTEASVGAAKSFQHLLDNTIRTWEHFHVRLPRAVVLKGDLIGPKHAGARSTFDVFKRSVNELKADDVDTVLDLIRQGSLYRGEEHQQALLKFKAAQAAATSDAKLWAASQVLPAAVTRIRNTAIGSLLVDLSEGKDLEDAVKSFEAKVAPTNYKRPTALVTKAMVAKAAEQVEALGLTSALERRYAVAEDIGVTNVLFADRTPKKTASVFDQVADAAPEKRLKLDKIEVVPIAQFLDRIVPTATSIDVLFENRLAGNLMSLIAPADQTGAQLFKWSNPFSWSYAGDVADSIKERVKNAGGSVTGEFRASLAWSNYDDLDLHLVEPDGTRIFFGAKQSVRTGGNLDVDMNAGGGTSRTPVENITYPLRRRMREGRYTLEVNQYSQRETKDHGFELEMEFDGAVHRFAWDKSMRSGQTVGVAVFDYTHKDGLTIVESLPSAATSKTMWDLPTQTFRKVSLLLLSPNFWDGQVGIGNKHFFFILDGCKNDGQARGFFNEFLRSDLDPHRKVLEMVGAKVRADASDRQLSGLGFSSTQRNHIVVRVAGSFTRTLKVTF